MIPTVLSNMDLTVQSWVLAHRIEALNDFFIVMTQLGSPFTFLFLTVLLTIALLVLRRFRDVFYLDAGLLITWALMHETKKLVGRPRPEGDFLSFASGYSFPSGHAMVSMFFYGFLAFLLYRQGSRLSRWLGHILVFLIFLIGFSRIYLNVHFLTDVIAGFIFGALCLAAMIKFYKKRRKGMNR